MISVPSMTVSFTLPQGTVKVTMMFKVGFEQALGYVPGFIEDGIPGDQIVIASDAPTPE
jgi:hypothetical protein